MKDGQISALRLYSDSGYERNEDKAARSTEMAVQLYGWALNKSSRSRGMHAFGNEISGEGEGVRAQGLDTSYGCI